VHVRLTPSGEVLSANVVRSSGNAVFDRSVENAVYKAAPLPLPGDPTLFDNFREIRFVFDPDKET
jgi:colicin import membrane protein